MRTAAFTKRSWSAPFESTTTQQFSQPSNDQIHDQLYRYARAAVNSPANSKAPLVVFRDWSDWVKTVITASLIPRQPGSYALCATNDRNHAY